MTCLNNTLFFWIFITEMSFKYFWTVIHTSDITFNR
jgi:hypothetical protein